MTDREADDPGKIDRYKDAGYEKVMEVARSCASMIGDLWRRNSTEEFPDAPQLEAADQEHQQAQE